MSKVKRKPSTITAMKRRIRKAFALATTEQLEQGLSWYEKANSEAKVLEKASFILDLEQSCGLLAALSPHVSWDVNVKDAHAILRDYEAIVSTYGNNRSKAIALLDGKRPDDVLGGNKVKAFFRCIFEYATTQEVVVDRHSARLALNRDLNECCLLLGRKGIYQWIARAYQEVAFELGIKPHECQAVTWLVFRVQLKKV
jgi:hypothetical protein